MFAIFFTEIAVYLGYGARPIVAIKRYKELLGSRSIRVGSDD